MYRLGSYEGRTVYRVGIDEYVNEFIYNTKDFFVWPDGGMYFCGERVGYVYNNQVSGYNRDTVKRLESKVFREKVAKAFENVEAKPIVEEVRESVPTSEEKSVVTDSETADRILQSWQGNIDGVLEGLMNRELIEQA